MKSVFKSVLFAVMALSVVSCHHHHHPYSGGYGGYYHHAVPHYAGHGGMHHHR